MPYLILRLDNLDIFKKQLRTSAVYIPLVTGCILFLVILLYPMFTCIAFIYKVRGKKASGVSVGRLNERLEERPACFTLKNLLCVIFMGVVSVLVWFVHSMSIHYVIEKNQDVLLWRYLQSKINEI